MLLIYGKNKKFKLWFAIGVSCILLLVVAIAIITGNFDTFGRFLTLSFKESTFVGRILYFRDALPLILKHPFGIGYGGYYYIQQSIQTGLYSVRYIHNDFLQIALDIGWVPFIMLIWVIIKTFLKTKDFRRRLLLFVFVTHSCFDFNLQFVAMYFVLLALLDVCNGKQKIIKGTVWKIVLPGIIVGCICCYIGIAQILSFMGQYELSNKWYPFNTENDIKLLATSDELEGIEYYADRIISRNEHIYVAYNAKASIAFSNGSITDVMRYSNLAIQEAPLQSISYDQYCYFLIQSISLYQQSGDMSSARYCQHELRKIVNQKQTLNKRLSKLGTMIKDQPNMEVSDEIMKYIENMK